MKATIKDEKVEITLDKFLEVVGENHELKNRLNGVNPWMKWVHFAHMTDSFRLFPRLFFAVYILLMGYSGFWFMALAAPTVAQAGFISTLVGAGAAWFGLYVNSGWKHNNKG